MILHKRLQPLRFRYCRLDSLRSNSLVWPGMASEISIARERPKKIITSNENEYSCIPSRYTKAFVNNLWSFSKGVHSFQVRKLDFENSVLNLENLKLNFYNSKLTFEHSRTTFQFSKVDFHNWSLDFHSSKLDFHSLKVAFENLEPMYPLQIVEKGKQNINIET